VYDKQNKAAYPVDCSVKNVVNKLRRYAMIDSTENCKDRPALKIADPLTDLLRNGAKELIAQAVKAELESLLL
jgi:hypothetical protein